MGSYVSSFFSPGFRPANYDKICYTYYDFADDQLPELLISAYYKGSDTYAIVDAFGTDGTTVSKLLGDTTGKCDNSYVDYILSLIHIFLVVLEIVDGFWRDSVFFNQSIGGHAASLHCFP